MMTEDKFPDLNDLPERLRGHLDDEPLTAHAFLFLWKRYSGDTFCESWSQSAEISSGPQKILGVGRATIYQSLARMRVEKKEESA